jgi:hypothetical protein
MRRTLSSFTTLFPMVVYPLFLLLCMVGLAGKPPPLLAGLLFWAILIYLFYLSAKFSWRLCFASTDGVNLFLYSYRGLDSVPLTDIRAIKALSRSEPAYIEIALDPPIRLGASVAIMPPIGFTKAAFWNVYELLADTAKDASHDVKELGDSRRAGKNFRTVAVAVWIVIVVGAVLLLALKPGHR